MQPAAFDAGRPDWSTAASLRRILSAESATLLGHDAASDGAYAFAAFDVPATAAEDVKRSVVILPPRTIITFDHVLRGAATWKVAGTAVGHRTLLPHEAVMERVDDGISVRARSPREDVAFLNVIGARAVDVSSLDLAGAMCDDFAVFFHSDSRSATSAVSFVVETSGMLRYLITGLAPGAWQVWRDGWLLDPVRSVRRESGTLYFSDRAGSYFLRRLA